MVIGYRYVSGHVTLSWALLCALLQMTLTSWGFSSRCLVLWLRSYAWRFPFVIPSDVDASTKKATMKISEYSLQLWWKDTKSWLFFFLMHSVSLYFSYNWPAQNSSVEYGDADEVNLQSTPRSLEVKSKKRKSKVTSYFLFFTGSFPPQVFLRYLTADTEDAM